MVPCKPLAGQGCPRNRTTHDRNGVLPLDYRLREIIIGVYGGARTQWFDGGGVSMNPRRVAVLLRQLADAMEEDESDTERSAPEKRLPAPRPPPPLLGSNAPAARDRERARHELRRLGYRVSP